VTLSINLTYSNIARIAAVISRDIPCIFLRRRVNFTNSKTSGSVEQDTAAITSRRGIDIARQNISSSAQLDLTAIVRGSRVKIACFDFSFVAKQRNSGG
jgi:hypothetical protein